MDTSNNPFASDSVPFQKPGLLLDLGAGSDVFKQNGTSPSADDLYFLDRPANGKGNFDDDDFGPETDVDAVDDVLLSPTKIANSPKNKNPFEDEDLEKRAFEADLEIGRQQTREFDPVRESRQETPTPPADEISRVTNLVPEPENVAESGEDSEDEWNYYRVEPKAETADTNQQSTQEVCEKSAQQLEEEENMESQLNPNAAEFVPSPTQLMPSMEDILLAESPKKGITMENISVPSHLEFQQEVSQRPSELDSTDEPQQKIAAKLPDLISSEEGGDTNPFLPSGAVCGKSFHHLENGGSFKDFLDQGDRNFQELQDRNLQASGGLALDESEVSSTKAEFGDDSTMSFMTSVLQKTIAESVASFSEMDKSFTEQEVLETEVTSDMTTSDVNDVSDFHESDFFRDTTTEEEEEEDSMIIKNTQDAVHMSFEIQKELVPEMESKPERVQLESEGTSSFEQDESSSPLHADSKVPDFNEKVSTYLQAPVLEEEEVVTVTVDVDLQASEIPNAEQKLSSPDVDMFLVPESLQEVEQLSLSPVTSQIEEEGLSPKPSIPEDGGLSPVPHLSPSQSQSPPQSPVLSNKSIHSPLLSKPELSPLQSEDFEQNFDDSPKSPVVPLSPPKSPVSTQLLLSPPKSPVSTQLPLSPPKSPLLEELLLTAHSLPEQQQIETPRSPVMSNSPILDAGSPLPSAVDTALSTPETVPVGKDGTPSPVLESKSPVDYFSALIETQEKVEVTHDNEQPPQFDITGLRHPSNTLPTEESQAEISDLLVKTVEDVPPPTTTHLLEDVLSTELIAESEPVAEKVDVSTEKVDVVTEKVDLQTEKIGEKKEETTEIVIPAVAVAAATAAIVTKAVEEKPAEKKSSITEVKKTATPAKDKKGPLLDKTRATKTGTTKPATPTTAKLNQKSTPTSPTKPLSTVSRTSTPKKPLTAAGTTTSTLSNKVTKSPTVTTAKPKSTTTTKTTTSTTRVSSTTKPLTGFPHPKPVSTTTVSKSAVLTNGEAGKPATARKLGTTTATKPPARPATAPAATKTTTTKQVTSVASRTTVTTSPRPKPGAVNGTATKPRTIGTTAPAMARSKVGVARDAKQVTDKQVKETANKQISSSRSVAATKSATTTTAKRVSGVTKTSASVTNAAKSATKKSTVTATSKSSTKTLTTATEKSEVVQVQQVVD